MGDRDGRDIIALCLPFLEGLLPRFVFTGGCVVGLLVDEPLLTEPRATDDADAIVNVASASAYIVLQQGMIDRGWQPDMNLACRFRHGPLTIDVMPPDEGILGFANRWHSLGLSQTLDVKIADRFIRVIAPEVFLATKLEAFADRGKGDPLGSHDFEDIVYVLAGRADIVGRIAQAPDDLRDYLRKTLPPLLSDDKGMVGVEGALAYHPADSVARVFAIAKEIAALP